MLVAFCDHEGGELDVPLLEGVAALLVVGNDGVPGLPFNLVERVDALLGEVALERPVRSASPTSRSFVAMTPPVRLRGKDYIGVIRGAYYTPEAEPCQASFSQYVAPSGENLPCQATTSSGARNLPLMHPRILWGSDTTGLRATFRAGSLSPGASPIESWPARGAAVAFLQQQAELALEVGDLLEVLVDAGESHVRDVVQLPEERQHLQPDLLRRHDGALAAELLLYLGRWKLLYLLLPATCSTRRIARTDLGEADRIVTLFSREAGKIRAVARGVRRGKSRAAGHLEPFTLSDVMFAVGRELDVISQADTVEPFRAVREDVMLATHAYYLAEMVDLLTEDRQENQAVFDALVDGLHNLAAHPDARLVLVVFHLRLLDALGYRPELRECVGCRAASSRTAITFRHWWAGCCVPACGPAEGSARAIGTSALKLLRFVQQRGGGVNAPGHVTREAEALLRDYAEHIVERRLRSPALIARVQEADR